MSENQTVEGGPGQDFQSLGANLRARRLALGMTLQDVASRANLSVGFISQVERNLTSPSLSSLAALSRTLDADIAEFFPMPRNDSSTTRSGNRVTYSLDENDVSFERISTSFPDNVLNAVIVHEQPGYRSEEISHAGEELFYVIDGSLTIEIDGKASVLHTGDTIHFQSGSRHSTWNHTAQTATVLIVCTMDVFGD